MPPDFQEDLRRRLLLSLGPREALTLLQGGTPLLGDMPRTPEPTIDMDRVAQDVSSQFGPTIRAGLGIGLAGGAGLAAGLGGLPLLGDAALSAAGGGLGEAIASPSLPSAATRGLIGAAGGAAGPFVGRGLSLLGGRAYRALKGLLGRMDGTGSAGVSAQPLIAPPEQFGGLGRPGVAPASPVDEIGLLSEGPPARYGLLGSDVQPAAGLFPAMRRAPRSNKPLSYIEETAKRLFDELDFGGDRALHFMRASGDPMKGTLRYDPVDKDAVGKAIFRRTLSEDEWHGLVGLPKGGDVRVFIDPKENVARMRLMAGKMSGSARLLRDENGALIIHADSLGASGAAPGVGFRMAAHQAKTASRLGIQKIKTIAAGNGPGAARLLGEGEESGVFTGYWTWAKIGYDGEVFIPRDLRPVFGGAEFARISEIMASKEGRRVWKEYGFTWPGEFSLAPDSYSMKVLDRYIERMGRRLKKK